MTMMTRPTALVYLDDVRNVIPRGSYRSFCVCRSYDAFVENVEHMVKDYDVYVSFDHDLGEDKSGYDCAKWIVENHIPIKGFSIHSMNPVGVANIRQLLTHYGYEEFHY